MEFYSSDPNTLEHYGVKGMKWGVRREYAKANRTRKKLSRNLASTRRNLLDKARESEDSVGNYKAKTESYSKTAGRIAITKSQKAKKEADMQTELAGIHDAAENLKNSRSDYIKARAWYDKDAKDYINQVNTMINKFGAESTPGVKTKNYTSGKEFSETLINTGLTVADLPVIGKSYRERYIAKKDAQQRSENVNRILDEERKKYY